MNKQELRRHAECLPTTAGIYQFLAGETILYIGKAVDIQSRVKSYTDPRSERIRQMVSKATDIEYVVTDTERQALLLESNLIKRHQPKYNVRLKDDKSYPLVQLTGHAVPRIEVTRDPDEGATVFGPFTRESRVDVIVKAIRQMYGLRGCSESKYRNRDRPCLDYDIGICSAPCTGEISEDAYREDVTVARRFFDGETGILADPLRDAMVDASESEEFERAANLRDRLRVVETFHGTGEDVIHQQRGSNTIDSLGVTFDGSQAIVARLHSDNGKLIDRSTHTLDIPEETHDIDAVLCAFVVQYYSEREFPERLLVPAELTDSEVMAWLKAEQVYVEVPASGRKKKLVDLAMKNARSRPDVFDDVSVLADKLGVSSASRIEGFDVSHAQGTDVVGSNVLFVDGEADSTGYRRKKLSEKNDDYGNMRELIRWRAKRAVEGRDDRVDPDILLIDGGRGQLNAAQAALSSVGWDVPVVALAKDEELVVTENGVESWDSKAGHLHVLQQVRDEAHRFALEYHQSLRDDVTSVLDSIDGVGPNVQKELLRRFGSVEGVRESSEVELQEVDGVGEKTARQIWKALHGDRSRE